MQSNYAAIIDRNLEQIYSQDLTARASAMAARQAGEALEFRAFGASCTMTPQGIVLDDQPQTGPLGIILSLYALHATPDPMEVTPFKAFKELPNSMPYVGAFTSHTEQILESAVDRIIERRTALIEALDGQAPPSDISADAAMVVRPLPKIGLCYIFYVADEDFPASVTCLFSSNAYAFLPMDGLADVGEYTSKTILDLLP